METVVAEIGCPSTNVYLSWKITEPTVEGFNVLVVIRYLYAPLLPTTMSEGDQSSASQTCCKVGRVLRRYGLEHLDVELERQWTGDDGESSSLRELSRELNRSVLESALTEAGVAPLDGESENLRQLLTSAETEGSRRIEARRRLENDGVDVDSVLADFVSHQTVHNHLRTCQGVSIPDTDSDEKRLSRGKSTIFGLQNRTEMVTEKTLAELGVNGLVSPQEFDVIVDIQAICEACGRPNDITDLLSTGTCPCQATSEN